MPAGWDDPSRNVAPPPVTVSSRGGLLIPASLRHDMIRDAAYFRAQARGFVPGKEIEDWLAAEQDVEDLIARLRARDTATSGAGLLWSCRQWLRKERRGRETLCRM
jgi:hypothetical protein